MTVNKASDWLIPNLGTSSGYGNKCYEADFEHTAVEPHDQSCVFKLYSC